jgi:hypothetical protein
MTQWAPIRYMGFWDVPLNFLVAHDGQSILFDCPFDEDIEDYAETYQVYLMPEISVEELPKDWTTLPSRAIRRLGEVPVASVQFDPTKRRQINTEVFANLMPQPVRTPG